MTIPLTNLRNRVVGLEYHRPSALLDHPAQWRTHPAEQVAALTGVLQEVGIAGALLAYRSDRAGGALVKMDGHLRAGTADVEWPVLVLDVTDAEADYILATHDPLAGMAGASADLLDGLLASVQTSNSAVQALLDATAHAAGLLTRLPPPGDGGDEFDATPAEGPTRCQVGDVWQIGDHVLACGDCLDPDVLTVLLGETRPAAIITDPPYGIDAVGSDGRIGLAKKFGRIEGDLAPFDPRFLLDLADEVVLWGANHYADKLPSSPCWLVWDKRDGDRHNDFADCELAWCKKPGVVRIFSHLWMGYARASERGVAREHPTQKPIAVMEWMIKERTQPGAVVADFYGGSGTTLVAAHRTGRVCRIAELEPRYADVCLRRAEAEGIGPIERI